MNIDVVQRITELLTELANERLPETYTEIGSMIRDGNKRMKSDEIEPSVKEAIEGAIKLAKSTRKWIKSTKTNLIDNIIPNLGDEPVKYPNLDWDSKFMVILALFVKIYQSRDQIEDDTWDDYESKKISEEILVERLEPYLDFEKTISSKIKWFEAKNPSFYTVPQFFINIVSRGKTVKESHQYHSEKAEGIKRRMESLKNPEVKEESEEEQKDEPKTLSLARVFSDSWTKLNKILVEFNMLYGIKQAMKYEWEDWMKSQKPYDKEELSVNRFEPLREALEAFQTFYNGQFLQILIDSKLEFSLNGYSEKDIEEGKKHWHIGGEFEELRQRFLSKNLSTEELELLKKPIDSSEVVPAWFLASGARRTESEVSQDKLESETDEIMRMADEEEEEQAQIGDTVVSTPQIEEPVVSTPQIDESMKKSYSTVEVPEIGANWTPEFIFHVSEQMNKFTAFKHCLRELEHKQAKDSYVHPYDKLAVETLKQIETDGVKEFDEEYQRGWREPDYPVIWGYSELLMDYVVNSVVMAQISGISLTRFDSEETLDKLDSIMNILFNKTKDQLNMLQILSKSEVINEHFKTSNGLDVLSRDFSLKMDFDNWNKFNDMRRNHVKFLKTESHSEESVIETEEPVDYEKEQKILSDIFGYESALDLDFGLLERRVESRAEWLKMTPADSYEWERNWNNDIMNDSKNVREEITEARIKIQDIILISENLLNSSKVIAELKVLIQKINDIEPQLDIFEREEYPKLWYPHSSSTKPISEKEYPWNRGDNPCNLPEMSSTIKRKNLGYLSPHSFIHEGYWVKIKFKEDYNPRKHEKK